MQTATSNARRSRANGLLTKRKRNYYACGNTPLETSYGEPSQKSMKHNADLNLTNDDGNDDEHNGTRRDINSLPIEVLSNIVYRLPTWARKDVKLVCRKWFDSCNVKYILDTERLVIDGRFCGTYNLTNALSLSERKFMNLEFRNMIFDDYDVNFWRKNGSKIGSITFSNCVLDIETIENVLVHCENLRDFSWIQTIEFKDLFMPEKDMKILISKNVVNNAVESFVIDFAQRDIGVELINNTMKSIFLLFPNIRHFNFKHPNLKFKDLNFGDFEFKKKINLAANLNIAVLSKTLVFKDENFVFDSDLRDVFQPATKLKLMIGVGRVDSRLRAQQPGQKSNEIFLSVESRMSTNNHKELHARTTLDHAGYGDGFVNDSISEITSIFLQCMIRECPSLKELVVNFSLQRWLSTDTKFRFDSLFFEHIATSSIEVLAMKDLYGGFKLILGDDIKKCQKVPQNFTLKRLHLAVDTQLSAKAMANIMGIYCQLSDLMLGKITNVMLHSIYKHYQKNLVMLQLPNSKNITNTGLRFKRTRKEYSLASLTELTFLKMQLGNTTNTVFNLLNQLVNLRFLSLTTKAKYATFCRDNLFTPNNLPDANNTDDKSVEQHEQASGLILLKDLPYLEGLAIDFSYQRWAPKLDVHPWKEFCAGMKRLRVLSLGQGKDVKYFSSQHNYEDLFSVCDTLRFVHFWGNTFYYDVIKHAVKEKVSTSVQYSWM